MKLRARQWVRRARVLVWASLGAAVFSGCSIKKMAVNKLGDALSQSGQTFASEEDPELVRDAAPFSLKLMESLLAEVPRHEGLLLAAASGFTQYAYAFVQQEADRLREEDLEQADQRDDRARRLYLRARDYGLRGLETRHPKFRQQLEAKPREAVKVATVKDVPLLFWTAAALGAAISISKDDPAMIADQVTVEALIDRALALDEDWDHGALHTFLISYEMARQSVEGDPVPRARAHLERAVELSHGHQAGPFVAFAESVSVQQQDRAEFEKLLQAALAIDPDTAPQWRLANVIVQARARWLLSRVDELFFTPKTE